MNEYNQYVVFLDNEQFGPYSLDTIREMRLMTDTLVKIQSGGEYRPASSYPELKDYLTIVENRQSSNVDLNLDTSNFYYRENGQMYVWQIPSPTI